MLSTVNPYYQRLLSLRWYANRNNYSEKTSPVPVVGEWGEHTVGYRLPAHPFYYIRFACAPQFEANWRRGLVITVAPHSSECYNGYQGVYSDIGLSSWCEGSC